ncbi:MAG: hypothetical protein AB8B53_01035 [Flavobacteriales bacterium]
MKRLHLFTCLIVAIFTATASFSQMTATIGENSSSSSTRGPLQRSDTASSTVFSRWVQIFTADELSTAGITSGASISELRWELASSNTIIGDGDANVKIYVRNSAATEAISDTWVNYTAGSELLYDTNFNTTNNFPGANGWMPFALTSEFMYTGGSLEIAVDWDCSQVSTPAFSGDGSLKWRWTTTDPAFLVAKKTSSSSPSSTLSDLRDERANIQIVYELGAACAAPDGAEAITINPTSAVLEWSFVEGASEYNWKIVPGGEGEDGTEVASGTTPALVASVVDLSELTSYDFYVQSVCAGDELSSFSGPFSFATSGSSTLITTIGDGTSSSSSRGPFQRSDTSSSTVYSRWVHIYTQSELAAAGISGDDIISAVNWELASSNVIIGDGNANLKVYVRNSEATEATAGDWGDLTAGSALVYNNDFNTTNNFPGENGWMAFDFTAPFTYTGGAIEVAVDWDCSQVSTPAFSGDGSLKWRWTTTEPDFLVAKKTSSSSPSSNISDLRDERANIQFAYSEGSSEVLGCMDCSAENYNPEATMDDGSCEFLEESCKGDFNDDGAITITDLSGFLAAFGTVCD